MADDIIEIDLKPEERLLLLRYGYPFEPIKSELEARAASPHVESIPMGSFWLEKLIGDMCRSVNDMKRGPLQDRLAELCDRLEFAERYGDGTLDDF